MNNDIIHESLARLKAIDWERYDESRTHSQVLLVYEYLRRVGLWAQSLNARGTEVFPNIPVLVKPDCVLSAEVEPAIEGLAPDSRTKKICLLYVLWKTIEDSAEVAHHNLPAPYEPLIRLYERGGEVSTEHGFIIAGGKSLYAKSWADFASRASLDSLDDATLDKVDEAAHRELLVA